MAVGDIGNNALMAASPNYKGGVNAQMMAAYLSNQKAQPVIARASQIADTTQAQGNSQLDWSKAVSDQLMRSSGASADEIAQNGRAAQAQIQDLGNAQIGVGNQQVGAGQQQIGVGQGIVGLGGQQIGVGQQQVGAGQDLLNKANTEYTRSQAQADTTLGRSNQQWNTYLNNYVPVELQSLIDSVGGIYADDNTFKSLSTQFAGSIADPTQRQNALDSLNAMHGASKAGAEAAAGEAAGAVGASYGAQAQDQARVLGARGITPEKAAMLSRITGVQQAADTASASNAARTASLQQGVTDRQQQAAYGRNFISASSALAQQADQERQSSLPWYQQSNNFLNSGVGNIGAGANTQAQGAGVIGQGAATIGQGGASYGNAANTIAGGAQLLGSSLSSSASIKNAAAINAANIQNSAQGWYNQSLNASGTQLDANQAGDRAVQNAFGNDFSASSASANRSAQNSAGIGQLAGTLGAAAILAFSSKKLKTNRKAYKSGLRDIQAEAGDQEESPAAVNGFGRANEAMAKMPVDSYKYKKGIADEGEHIGPMAEDVQQATDGQASDGKKVDLISLVGITMQAVRELAQQVATLKGSNMNYAGNGMNYSENSPFLANGEMPA